MHWSDDCLDLINLITCNSICELANMVKNLSTMQGTWVQSLGQEEPLEKGKTTHGIILAWRFPWTEEPGRL